MNFFEFMLLGHLAGDFLFQTNWMAREKANNLAALFSHSAVYTLFIGLGAMLAGRLTWQALLVVLLSHMFLDNRNFINFWVRHVTRSSETEWLKVAVDQCWHIIVLGVVAYFF
jgi:hypothetical protein